MNSEKISGLQIVGFYHNSQLLKSGVEEGDWIVKYNGEKILNADQLKQLKIKFQALTNIFLSVRKKSGEQEYYEILPGDLGVYLTEIDKNPEIMSDAVRIKNVDRLEEKTGKENTFFHSIFNVFNYFEIEIELNMIINFSAVPFRFQFTKEISKNMLDPTEGFNCVKVLLDNLQIKHRELSDKSLSKKKLETEIIKSIDNKFPALARNCYGKQDWGIITGYQNKKADFFCRSFHDKTINYSLAPNFPDKIILFDEVPDLGKFENNNFAEQHEKALATARKILNLNKYNGFYLGNNGMQEWIKFLKDSTYFEKLSEEEFNKICMIHKKYFDVFQLNCTIAFEYFEFLIEEFPESKAHLRQLRKFFRAESKILYDCQKKIPFLHDKAVKEIWSNSARAKQVVALEKIYKKNREILAVIGKLPLIQ